MSYSSSTSDNSYTSQQPGWRIVFVSLLIAAIFGMAFRTYFSPKRIKGWIEAELHKQPAKIELKFDTAELRLARGALPQLAIRLTNVEGRSARSCAKEAGFKISEIFIPFRVADLLKGKVAVGTVHGENLAVNLDALRDRCEAEALAGAEKKAEAPTAPVATVPAKPTGQAIAQKGSVRPWWTPEQLQTVKNLVSGLSFETVALSFEHGAKSVVFEDLGVRADVAPDSIWLATDVRVPPALLFSQTLPPFALEATVRPDSADVEIRGNLSEGSLNGLATLKAASNDVSIDAHLSVLKVPLAGLLPFLKQAGWANGKIEPRFIWLDCEASIKGELGHLFKENPVTIEKCSLDGDSGQIAIEKAVVGPGAAMQPFEVKLAGLDVQKILNMIHARGPSGVMSKFGRLAGRINVLSRDQLEFEGALMDAQFRFSNRNVRGNQAVAEIRAKAAYKDSRLSIAVENMDLVGGRFKGRIALDLDPAMKQGRIETSISELSFHPEVQALMVGGAMSGVKIDGSGEIEAGRLTSFKGDVGVALLEGAQVRLRDGSAKVLIEKDLARFDVNLPQGEISQASRLFTGARPIFLGHDFETQWVPFKDGAAVLKLQNRNLSWEKSSVLFRNGQIWVTGAGGLSEAGVLRGWVAVDFPKLKKLKWNVAGNASAPELDPLPKTKADIKREPIDSSVLGIFIAPSKNATVSQGGDSTPEDARSLGQKVLDRAKSILPKIENGTKPASTTGH